MTYWMTITLTLFVALFMPLIDANSQQKSSVSNKMKLIDTPQENNVLKNRLQKRASFMPSRGKKEGNEELTELSSPEKKASGFLPMRGRKDDSTQSLTERWYADPRYDYFNGQEDKRAGFMPMRGRKSGQNTAQTEINAPVVDVYPSQLDAITRIRNNYEQPLGQPYSLSDYQVAQPYSVSEQRIGSKGRPNWMEGQHSMYTNTKGMEGMVSTNGGLEMEKKANAFFGARGKRSVDNHFEPISAHKSHHKNNENFFATRG